MLLCSEAPVCKSLCQGKSSCVQDILCENGVRGAKKEKWGDNKVRRVRGEQRKAIGGKTAPLRSADAGLQIGKELRTRTLRQEPLQQHFPASADTALQNTIWMLARETLLLQTRYLSPCKSKTRTILKHSQKEKRATKKGMFFQQVYFVNLMLLGSNHYETLPTHKLQQGTSPCHCTDFQNTPELLAMPRKHCCFKNGSRCQSKKNDLWKC